MHVRTSAAPSGMLSTSFHPLSHLSFPPSRSEAPYHYSLTPPIPRPLLFLNRSLSTSQTNSTSPYPPFHTTNITAQTMSQANPITAHVVTRVPQRCAPYARNFRCAGTGALPAYLSTYKPAPFHTRPLSKLIGTSSSLHHLTLIEHRETCYPVAPPDKISLSLSRSRARSLHLVCRGGTSKVGSLHLRSSQKLVPTYICSTK